MADHLPIALIGICDRFKEIEFARAKLPNGNIAPLSMIDLLGLRRQFAATIYPIPSDAFHLVFVCNLAGIEDGFTDDLNVLIKDSNANEIGNITLSVRTGFHGEKVELDEGENYRMIPVDMSKMNIIFQKPGLYTFFLKKGKEEALIGKILLLYKKLSSLTEDQIKIIKNDPLASKHSKFHIECNKCNEKIEPYASFEKDVEYIKKNGFIWYKDLPDEFVCKCGETKIDMSFLRENMHGLLGRRARKYQQIEAIEMDYDNSSFIKTIQEFKALVESETEKNTGEKTLQKFIEDNPIILSCFSPKDWKAKGEIGSKFETDFVVLNQKKELLLIEIEKPTTKLFKKKGGKHSEIVQAFGQVQDWLNEGRKDRLGVIRNLKMNSIKFDDVCEIRGIVIAGRTKEEDMEYMGKLLHDYNDIDFFTYDHLIEHLAMVARSLRDL